MDPVRFDQISKRLATWRFSRRHAVRGLGAAGLAGALLAGQHEHAAADCPDLTRCVCDRALQLCAAVPDFPLPGGPSGTCWDWNTFTCYPCSTSWDALTNSCNQSNPACQGQCYARF